MKGLAESTLNDGVQPPPGNEPFKYNSICLPDEDYLRVGEVFEMAGVG